MTTYGRGLRALTLATILTIAAALALVFFYAPLDADQGFIQKIFYVHVPLAIVSLCGFILGALFADKANYEIIEGAPRRAMRVGVAASGRMAAVFAANAD